MGAFSLCAQFDSRYSGGVLSCFPPSDPHGRGCTYNFTACTCTQAVARIRTFPRDGGPGDLDGQQNGQITVMNEENVYFDGSGSCSPCTN